MQTATVLTLDQTDNAPVKTNDDAAAIREGILLRREQFEAALPAYLKRGAKPKPGRLSSLDRENNDLLLDSM